MQSTSQLAGGKGANRTPLVETAKARPAVITESLQSVGSLESPFRVQISPLTSGRIEQMAYREGDTVHAKDVVARIDSSDADLQVIQSQSSVAEAESRLAQAKLGQNSTSVTSSANVTQQLAALTSARADLNQTQQNVSAQVAAASDTIIDATAKLNSAKAQVANASAIVGREQASVANSKVHLDRVTELYRQRFVAAQDLDDAKTAYQVQLSAVKVADAQLAAANQSVSSASAVLNGATQQKLIVERKANADVASAKARETQASQALKMATANTFQPAAYKENLAALQSVVVAARAALSQARARREQTVLRSSITGTVTARTADPGSLASPSTPIMTIQYLDWLFFNAAFPIETSGRIYVGQSVVVGLDGQPERPIDGTITDVNLVADPQSRQYTVRVKISNTDHKLRAGMFGHIQIITKVVHAEAAVPKEAVRQAGGKTTVVVVSTDKKAHVRDVVIGASDDKVQQILSGVTAGEVVVSGTYATLKDGQGVNVADSNKTGKGGGKGNRRGATAGAPAGGSR